MITKVAIPLQNDVLAEIFREHKACRVYEIEGDRILGIQLLHVRFNHMEDILDWFSKNSITDLIVHKIFKKDIDKFINSKVNLFLGVKQTNADTLIHDFLDRSLISDVKFIVN